MELVVWKLCEGELCDEVMEGSRVSDGSCVSFLRGCAEAYLWACSAERKKFEGKTVFRMV